MYERSRREAIEEVIGFSIIGALLWAIAGTAVGRGVGWIGVTFFEQPRQFVAIAVNYGSYAALLGPGLVLWSEILPWLRQRHQNQTAAATTLPATPAPSNPAPSVYDDDIDTRALSLDDDLPLDDDDRDDEPDPEEEEREEDEDDSDGDATVEEPPIQSAEAWIAACERVLRSAFESYGACLPCLSATWAETEIEVGNCTRDLLIFLFPEQSTITIALEVSQHQAPPLPPRELRRLANEHSNQWVQLVAYINRRGSLTARCDIHAPARVSFATVHLALKGLTALCTALHELLPPELRPQPSKPIDLRPRAVKHDDGFWSSHIDDANAEHPDQTFIEARRAISRELLRREPEAAGNCGYIREHFLDKHPDLKAEWERIHRQTEARAQNTKVADQLTRSRWVTQQGWRIQEDADDGIDG